VVVLPYDLMIYWCVSGQLSIEALAQSQKNDCPLLSAKELVRERNAFTLSAANVDETFHHSTVDVAPSSVCACISAQTYAAISCRHCMHKNARRKETLHKV
jgi:DNA-directed RNA polymerase subunit RPC12/RpoP